MSKAQALHNEEACQYLNASGGRFNDWVVTTAFYSALHSTQYEIFPIDVNGLKLNFENYYKQVGAKHSASKHDCMVKLVNIYLPSCSGAYRWLYDACMKARYKNYNISNLKANAALQRLNEIKKSCVKPEISLIAISNSLCQLIVDQLWQ